MTEKWWSHDVESYPEFKNRERLEAAVMVLLCRILGRDAND